MHIGSLTHTHNLLGHRVINNVISNMFFFLLGLQDAGVSVAIPKWYYCFLKIAYFQLFFFYGKQP